MRLAFAVAALALFTSACGHLPHHHAGYGDGGGYGYGYRPAPPAVVAVVGGALVVRAIAAAASRPEPEAPTTIVAPVVVMSHHGEFDRRAAKDALRGIEYRDCGRGGGAKVVLVFRGSSGTVLRAKLEGSTYSAGVEECVLLRFQTVHVPPFNKEVEHAVSWGVWLPTNDETAPREPDPEPTAM